MKRTLQAFSLGLLVAGLIMVTTFLFLNYETTPSQTLDDLDEDEVIDIMKDKGYRVVSESEYISLSLSDSEENQSEEEVKNNDKDKDKNEEVDKKDEETKTIKYTLHIKDGMLSSEIGDLLEQNEIIDDGDKFNSFLEDEGYSSGVQLGNFKVNSDMNFKEIAKKFTK